MAKEKLSTKAEKVKEVKVEVTNLENIRPIYSNYVQIAHTPQEFVINFCYIDQQKMPKEEPQKVFAECFSRIIVSPSFLPNIIEALQINQKKYNENIQEIIEKIKKGAKK